MSDATIRRHFAGLTKDNYRITSPEDGDYNCIAWAARDTDRKWWPYASAPWGHWPDGVPREETVQAFVAAFATLGYEPCADGSLETGYEKLAIYTSAAGVVTHMARQLPSGRWTSKLGDLEDIEHDTLEGLNGAGRYSYGSPAQTLRKAL